MVVSIGLIFRTEQLSAYISSLGKLISSFGLEMGVQIGCIYDDLVERRGWADPTSLFENVNSIHVADIYQYAENFDFGAEYLSSICNFWTETNNLSCKPVRFTTETNWPNFNRKNPDFLSFYWSEQLISYYNEGAAEHYIVGWDVTPSDLDKYKVLYGKWRKTLLSYSNKETLKNKNKVAVHLGVEQVFYNHNVKSIWNKAFEINNFISSQYDFISASENHKETEDIITNYMLEKNPGYLDNFNSIYFAKSDGYITEKAYQKLTNYLVEKNFINSNIYEMDIGEDLLVKYKNEYNEIILKLPATLRLIND